MQQFLLLLSTLDWKRFKSRLKVSDKITLKIFYLKIERHFLPDVLLFPLFILESVD